MRTLKIAIWSLIFLCAQSSCAQDGKGKKGGKKQEPQTVTEATPLAKPAAAATVAAVKYDLAKPTSRYELDTLLNEISAIEWIDEQTLAAVEDERGWLYLLSSKDGSIQEKFEFWQAGGDFEGLCVVGSSLWVLEAKGDLLEISNWRDASKRRVERYDTPLRKDNDAEGLCYDAPNNRLLIACKGSPLIGATARDHRAVYAFSLADKKLEEKPIVAFGFEAVRAVLAAQEASAYTHDDVLRKLEKGKVLPIMPSDIAIHPQTKEIYLLASDGMALMRFSADGGQLLGIWGLDPTLMQQPEGLTFTPSGDVWISSEARGGVASIQFFKLQ